MIFPTVLIFLSVLFKSESVQGESVHTVFESKGEATLVVLLNDCQNSTYSYSKNSLVNSAIWTVERINFLELLSPITLGLSVFQTCSEKELISTVFHLYENDNYVLGVVTEREISQKVKRFNELLNLKTKNAVKYYKFLVKSVVEFLSAVGLKDNVTLLTTEDYIMEIFYQYSMKSRVCIRECYVFQSISSMILNVTTDDVLVLFAPASDINQFVSDRHLEGKYADGTQEISAVFVPLDGNVPSGLPEGSCILLPPLYPTTGHFIPNVNIIPTPLLFEVAEPILQFVLNTKNAISTLCNETKYKVNCLRNKSEDTYDIFPYLTPKELLRTLKIEPLEGYFVYDIYKVEYNRTSISSEIIANIFQKPYTKLLSYHIFNDNFTFLDENFEFPSTNQTEDSKPSRDICSYPVLIKHENKVLFRGKIIVLRAESWIYAFVSLSLLGISFCIAIFIFLVISICKKHILEGNPVLTLLLLSAVILLFVSVFPFCIKETKDLNEKLCLTKALAITLSYAAVFSLILSRSILLSTASKELGFMSHIAGPVQSFLCLFILGVQAALSLHVIGKCQEIFNTFAFIYLISYDVMLLILLFCLTPLIYKSQRNYREGKYFSIAVALITIVWCVWLPCYLILENEWKEFMLCFGLVSTGGICLGAIFIPRTYLITIAAERNKITSAIPSLATATSSVDLYRAHPQPIYDCVNVAAINAAAVARAGVAPSAPSTTLAQPDLYSCPALPEDLDFDLRCDSPTNTDKITRF